MKLIKLTQGQVAMVDDADYEWLNQYKWYAHKRSSGNGYDVIRKVRIEGKQRMLYMARYILDLDFGNPLEADHKNHRTLDNSRDNLRACTHQENVCNKKLLVGTMSQFKGVSRSKGNKKWRVRIGINNTVKCLGYFDSEIQAAKVYDKAAKVVHGDYACFNFNNQTI